MYKRPETAATCPNKQFRNNSLLSLPICQEEMNKVIFVWVYELENNSQLWVSFVIYVLFPKFMNSVKRGLY